MAYTIPFIAVSPLAGKGMRTWGARMCTLVGMLLVAASFVVFIFISSTTGALLAIAGFVIRSVGQAFAYNISTTAAMEAVTEQKSGEASGVISMIRMIAIVFGVAVTGVLFKTLER